jgi:hypothetical protein
MVETFKNISESVKIFVMLIIYVGYMTWWASGISHEVQTIKEHMAELSSLSHIVEMGKIQYTVDTNEINLRNHIIADAKVTENIIKLAETVAGLKTVQSHHNDMIAREIEQHIKCATIMDAILKRLDRLENGG